MPVAPKHLAALTLAALACAGPCFAEDMAKVLSVEGVSVVQRSGAQPRILGAYDTLAREDVLNIGPSSHAIIEFTDQTQITLRPGTVFRMDALSPSQPDSLLKGLVKGGMRGAAFDARWCEDDCLKEEQRKPVTQENPVARVVEIKGTVASARGGGNARMLVPGAAIYERDGVATGANSHAVLVFSDGSRITLAENSRLAILAYRFDGGRRAGNAEIHHISGVARVQSGAIAKQGPEYYRFVTPLGEVRPHGTGWDSVAGGVKKVADEGADTVRETGETVVGAVQDTAGQAAQTALNATIRPIMETMSVLMTNLRDHPPTTEAGWNQMSSQMTQMSNRLHGALDDAIRVGGAVVESREFKSMVGLALAAELEMLAVGAALPTIQGADAGIGFYAALITGVQAARSNTYQSESLALVGLSDAELDRVSYNRYAAHVIIETEVGGYLASQGNAAANDFFSKAKAAAEELRLRARQAEEAAARAAAEAEQRAMEDAVRTEEEARAAELEAERLAADAAQRAEEEATKAVKTGQNIFDEVIEKTDTAVDKAGGATADWVGQTAGDAKDKAGKAAKTGQSIFDEVVEKTDTAVDKVGGTTADWVGQTVGDAKDGAGKVGTATADWVGQTAGDAKAGAGAQSGKALQAIEQIRAAEREFARQVSDLRNALRNATNLSEAEKQRVLGALDEWSRLVGEEVARLTAEVMKNPNAQVALTSLKIMAIVVATVATVIVVGAVIIPLAALTAVAHTAMTNPSVFEDVPASAITQATRSTDQAAEAMRAILAAMVEHGQLGAGEAQRFMATLGQTLAGQATQTADNAAQAGRDVRDQISDAGQDAAEDKSRLTRGQKARSIRHGWQQANSRGTERGHGSSGEDSQSGGESAGGTSDGQSSQLTPNIVVWDGSVEVAGHVVNNGESLQVTSDGQLVSGGSGDAVVSGAPRPDLVNVDPSLFDGGAEEAAPGLYVWAREGKIKLNRGGNEVEVAAGDAVVVSKDQVAQLDYVPSFLRFDRTPRPGEVGGRFELPAFVMPDGSIAGNCVAK